MDGLGKCAVVSAPTNIAIIKYWGKRCTKLNLPLNPSLSATLSQEHLKTTTKIEALRCSKEDELWLNGEKKDIQQNKRLLTCLAEIRRMAQEQSLAVDEANAIYHWKVRIRSENNFPTAAGLASSASGYAALVFGLGKLFGVKGDLTPIARQGSGSACRSLCGGFVEWRKGQMESGKDSVGVQVASKEHWPELRIFVVVVKETKKKIGSTEGMQSTVGTSELLKHRVLNVVENNMLIAKKAIMEKDFETFGKLAMKESNQLHAVCQDTYPPLHYLNDVSRLIMDMVHEYNGAAGATRAAYTFDAGPNACLFTTDEFASEIVWLISNFFPIHENGDDSFFRGLSILPRKPSDVIHRKIALEPSHPNLLKYVICTCLGDGPQLLNEVL